MNSISSDMNVICKRGLSVNKRSSKSKSLKDLQDKRNVKECLKKLKTLRQEKKMAKSRRRTKTAADVSLALLLVQSRSLVAATNLAPSKKTLMKTWRSHKKKTMKMLAIYRQRQK